MNINKKKEGGKSQGGFCRVYDPLFPFHAMDMWSYLLFRESARTYGCPFEIKCFFFQVFPGTRHLASKDFLNLENGRLI